MIPIFLEILQDIIANVTGIDQICLGCYSDDAPQKHPLFEGSLCEPCKVCKQV